MRYKAVLFDMDGTVLDTLTDLTNAVNHILEGYKMPPRSPQEVASFLGNGAATLLRKAAAPDTPEEQFAEMMEVTRQTVSRWETDEVVPELDRLLCMCTVL